MVVNVHEQRCEWFFSASATVLGGLTRWQEGPIAEVRTALFLLVRSPSALSRFLLIVRDMMESSFGCDATKVLFDRTANDIVVGTVLHDPKGSEQPTIADSYRQQAREALSYGGTRDVCVDCSADWSESMSSAAVAAEASMEGLVFVAARLCRKEGGATFHIYGGYCGAGKADAAMVKQSVRRFWEAVQRFPVRYCDEDEDEDKDEDEDEDKDGDEDEDEEEDEE